MKKTEFAGKPKWSDGKAVSLPVIAKISTSPTLIVCTGLYQDEEGWALHDAAMRPILRACPPSKPNGRWTFDSSARVDMLG